MHTLRLKLEVDKNTAYIMEKRFRILAHISNQIRKHVKKLLSRLENDKQYQQALNEYIRFKKSESDDKQVVADMKRLSKFMNETRESIGLTKNGLEKYASVMQRRYKKKYFITPGTGRSSSYNERGGCGIIRQWKRCPL